MAVAACPAREFCRNQGTRSCTTERNRPHPCHGGSSRRRSSLRRICSVTSSRVTTVPLTVLAGSRIAQVKTLQARATAAVLRARILAHLAREAQPELADVRIVRGPADFDPMMPPFVTAFLAHAWSRAAEVTP